MISRPKLFLLIFFILITQIFVINFLPYPFDHINVIILSLLWLIILTNDSTIVWLILLLTWLIELLSATPFGIDIVAIMTTLLIMNWLLTHILTNRSIYLTFILTLLGLIIYRSVFSILLAIGNFILPSFNLNRETAITMILEIILTGLVGGICYLLSYKLIRKINPSYVSLKKKKAYG